MQMTDGALDKLDELLEHNLNITSLMGIYLQLLSSRQQEFLDLYYNKDLSLNEIAQMFGITRQAVHDGLKRAIKSMYSYEEKLKIDERMTYIYESLNNIIEEINNNNNYELENIKHKISQILENTNLVIGE